MKYIDLMHSDRPCPFCAAAQDPKEKIIENEYAYLTYNLAPYHQDHLLVVPKRHLLHIHELENTEETALYDIERQAMLALHKLNYKAISTIAREGGVDTGQTLDHFHLHIIPDTRVGDLDLIDSDNRKVLSAEEVSSTIERIRGALE